MLRDISRVIILGALMLAPLSSASLVQASTHAHTQNITITWEDYFTTTSSVTALNNLIKQYEASHPGVTIQHTSVAYQDFFPKILRQAAAHSLPDIAILDNINVSDAAAAGILSNFGLLTKGWSQLSRYYKSSLSVASSQGQLYGLPIGNNDIALFYNVDLLKAAGISKPPVTWTEFRADAKKLTRGHTYGYAYSAQDNEGLTWNFEPFLWSNGGDLQHIDAKPSVQAASFLTSLMTDGSVSKSVLNWGHGDVFNQFAAGNAAMIEMGPWELPAAQATKGLHFGITYLPRRSASQAPSSPLGGEVWTIPATTPAREQTALAVIKWMQTPARIVQVDTLFGYLPAYTPATSAVVAANPLLKIFAAELPTSKARTAVLGTKYPQASEAIWKALQQALTGNETPQQALHTAQDTISAL